jgi:hypothetical protein
VKQGPVGDWVLEAGNVNLIGRYFNASITQADLALARGGYAPTVVRYNQAQNRREQQQAQQQAQQAQQQAIEAAWRAKSLTIYLQVFFLRSGYNGLAMSYKIVLTNMNANEWPQNHNMLIAAIKRQHSEPYRGFLKGISDLRQGKGRARINELTDIWVIDEIGYPLKVKGEGVQHWDEHGSYRIQYVPNMDRVFVRKGGPPSWDEELHASTRTDTHNGVNLHEKHGAGYTIEV